MKIVLHTLVFAACSFVIYCGIVGATFHIGTDGVRGHVHSFKYHIKQFGVKWAQDAKPCCKELEEQYAGR